MEHKQSTSNNLSLWLKPLMYVHGIGLVLGLLSLVPVLEGLCAVLSWLVTLSVIAVLFRLGKCNGGYRRGAVYMTLAFSLQLVNYCFSLVMMGQAFVPELAAQIGMVSGALMAGSTVCSYIGLYHTYMTHGIVAPGFSLRWHGLFLWSVGIGITVSVVSVVCAVFSLTWIAAVASLVYGLASFVFEFLRVIWLRDMLRQHV